jgi:membrane associated rhomboid family serine protease
MTRLVREFFRSLPAGPRLLLLLYATAYPVALLGRHTHAFELHHWLPLAPSLVWRGQVWRVVSYAFLPSGVVDWLISLFWLATLVSVVGRNWSARGFWGYSLFTAAAGALPIVLWRPGAQGDVLGVAAIIFGLLAAWDRFHRHERIVLLGIGEISVRQAVLLIAAINTTLIWFSSGWFLALAMLCGGGAGWIYLSLACKLLMRKGGGPARSERIARLEL